MIVHVSAFLRRKQSYLAVQNASSTVHEGAVLFESPVLPQMSRISCTHSAMYDATQPLKSREQFQQAATGH